MVLNIHADMYFNRTTEILEKDMNNSVVTMQIFPRRDGMLCGVDFVKKAFSEEFQTSVQQGKSCNNGKITIKSLHDGDFVKENETVITIEGKYADFSQIETGVLGILARASSIATNVNKICEIAKWKDIILMSARFDYFGNQIIDGYAAYIGGCRKFATMANCRLPNLYFQVNLEPVGTMPHALIAAYEGNTVKAALAFDNYIDKNVSRIVLVDFENDCVKTSLEVAKALGNKLYGVRLDTSKGMVDESIRRHFKDGELGLSEKYLIDNFSGVCPLLVENVRKALDKEGFGHVKIYVSGGFNYEKVKYFVENNVPFDGIGIGSSIYNNRIDFTADIVMVNGKPCAKVGRSHKPNNRLK